MKGKGIISLLLLGLALVQQTLAAEKLPLWEYGVGLAGWHAPHYLGADQHRGYLLPVPYFVYRGAFLRADREGVRGLLFDGDRLDIRLSGGGALPVDSDDNTAREGMDDLDFMLEVGPTLQYQLLDSGDQQLRFDLPVRAAFTLGSDFLNHQGWTANPRFRHELELKPWTITSTAGLVFSDRRYHGYIYDVGPADVRQGRPQYQSSAGFTASRFSLGVKRRFGGYFVGAQVSYYNLNGAANDNSPLLRQDDYVTVGMIIAKVLGESKQKAQH